MIEFYNVNAQIDERSILKNVSFRILKGEFAYLVGPSGAGKSTVLRIIYMDLLPLQGMAIIGKYSTAKIKQKQIPLLRRQIGVVFQDFKLLNDRNVFDNVAFALRVTKTRNSDIKRRVLRVLAEVNLSHKRNNYPLELSGGEQQRVAIARAIVNNPFIILADEPTGNLDNSSSLEIMQILERINNQGTAILMASHDEDLISRFPHRVISINNGVIIRE